jgi:O-antigen/teichoic acid export membrane protein
VRPALLALGLPGYPTVVNIALAVSKIGLGLLIVPAYGYIGSAALASALTLGSIGLLVRRALRGLAGQAAGRARTEQEDSDGPPFIPESGP